MSRRTHREGGTPADEGMTLIEVVVALGLFAVMSSAVLVVLVSAITTTTDDKARLEAVSLASRELEITRDTFTSLTRGPDRVQANRVVNPSPLPGGTAGQPIIVNNVPYTVVRTAQWSSVGSAASACDDGTTAELAYLRVKVEVSWPALGDRPPVTLNTVMTPPKGTYSSLQGHIGLKVIDSAGDPKPGVTVTAKASNGTTVSGATASDGCVLLAHLTAGSYTVTASQSGFVSLKGDPTASITAAVQAGQLWRGTIEYDQAASITATLVAPTGFTLPTSAVPVIIANSGLQPIGVKAITGTGNPRAVSNLWPYPSGYGVWAGACQDADPGLTGEPLPTLTTDRGGNATTTVTLAPLEVHAPANSTVTLTHARDTLCGTGATITLGKTGADGVLMASAPYGVWQAVVGTTSKEVVLTAEADAPIETVTFP
jgi:type II secretory pathway pseudopilin PulG